MMPFSIVIVQCTVSLDRSHLGLIRIQNYRRRLSSDEEFAYKLEISSESKCVIGEKLLKGLENYPSGIGEGVAHEGRESGKVEDGEIKGGFCHSRT
ncbi:trigger factor [Senna tora]|uniref:Trigger factor n=1 Tax=Senna tora TaxID=362788 RepID=A0A834W947_9FABA|nr:trigger factor [Senna tora]